VNCYILSFVFGFYATMEIFMNHVQVVPNANNIYKKISMKTVHYTLC